MKANIQILYLWALIYDLIPYKLEILYKYLQLDFYERPK